MDAGASHMESERSLDLAAVARRHVADLAATVVPLFGASIMAGRVWRFPFDDEVYELALVERMSMRELLSYSLGGGDNYPPISHLLFSGMHQLGLGPADMRLCCLVMTALSLVLLQALAIAVIGARTGAPVRATTRIVAVLLFGLSPLALGQGDALRWYPPFALLVSVFLALYLAPRGRLRLASAVPLGLAASTSFLAIVVALPFAIYRYVLERAFSRRFDPAFWLIVLLLASPGLVSAYAIAAHKLAHVVATDLEPDLLRSTAALILGFFGGGVVGIGHAWVILPAAAITLAALLGEVDRSHPASPAHLLLLTFVAMAVMVVVGLDRGRAFLYLAPVLAAILTLYLDRVSRERGVGATAVLLALLLIPALAVVATVGRGTRPFKRDAAIPYDQILDFIRTNAQGETLVLSSDPTVVWALTHEQARSGTCATYFMQDRACFSPEHRYESVFIVLGHSNRSRNDRFMHALAAKIAELTASRRSIARMHVGLDRDAALKTRLTGVPLDEFILSVELFR
jgi:hypothetical protein